MLLQEDGWRLAMAGTIAFYDAHRKQLHTIYVPAQLPNMGKKKVRAKFRREVEQVKDVVTQRCPISVWAMVRPTTRAI